MGGEGSGCVDLFVACNAAVDSGVLIHRSSRQDKEFHFQNWFRDRVDELGLLYDPPSRNSYPDFKLVGPAEGYEVKGLAYPGREATYDSNSQVPTGYHNGRNIFYVFGRYPKEPDGDDYPVIDLVMCHGDYLNADHSYVHENKSVRGFGSYGDIMIRDRKMYVSPTPFALTDGTAGQRTLILPKEVTADPRVRLAGELVRIESSRLVVGYKFDFADNSLTPQYIGNPSAGRRHEFRAYHAVGSRGPMVSSKEINIEELRFEHDD